MASMNVSLCHILILGSIAFATIGWAFADESPATSLRRSDGTAVSSPYSKELNAHYGFPLAPPNSGTETARKMVPKSTKGSVKATKAPVSTKAAASTKVPKSTKSSKIATTSSIPSEAPTSIPSEAPTSIPSEAPTSIPSGAPTSIPSEAPTSIPSEAPTSIPSDAPTSIPSDAPTSIPSKAPTSIPSEAPTSIPSEAPTSIPSEAPTLIPSEEPTSIPSEVPTLIPSVTSSSMPSPLPTWTPSPTKSLEIRVESSVCETPVTCLDIDWDTPEGIVDCFSIKLFGGKVSTVYSFDSLEFEYDEYISLPNDFLVEAWTDGTLDDDPDWSISLAKAVFPGDNELEVDPPVLVTDDEVCVRLSSEMNGITYKSIVFNKLERGFEIYVIPTCVGERILEFPDTDEHSAFCVALFVK